MNLCFILLKSRVGKVLIDRVLLCLSSKCLFRSRERGCLEKKVLEKKYYDSYGEFLISVLQYSELREKVKTKELD